MSDCSQKKKKKSGGKVVGWQTWAVKPPCDLPQTPIPSMQKTSGWLRHIGTVCSLLEGQYPGETHSQEHGLHTAQERETLAAILGRHIAS